MILTEQQEREEAQRSALNAQRYRKQTLQQAVRENIVKENQEANQESEMPEASAHRSRLAMMKAGAIKTANQEAGGAIGASAGGAVGSILPGPGTAIGIFLGRYLGKKWGITGIVIGVTLFGIVLMALSVLVYIVIIKISCENNLVASADYFTLNICPIFK